MVRRNLIHIRRTPELLLDVTLSPIMFVLLFSIVFGGAIDVGGEGGQSASYTNYLMAGHLRADGRVRRHVHRRAAGQRPAEGHDRPLPIAARWRSPSVLTGRTFTDLMRAALAVAIMWIVGLAVGFRPEGGLAGNAAGIGIMLLFGFALSLGRRGGRCRGPHAGGACKGSCSPSSSRSPS